MAPARADPDSVERARDFPQERSTSSASATIWPTCRFTTPSPSARKGTADCRSSLFLFGLTAQQAADSASWYSPHWHQENDRETRVVLDTISFDYFSRNESGAFAPIHDALLAHGAHYMHLADLIRSYLKADQSFLELYKDGDGWARKAILNVASSRKFSSERTIAQYAAEI